MNNKFYQEAPTVEDEMNIYKTDNFLYLIKDRLLKGSNLNKLKLMKRKKIIIFQMVFLIKTKVM